MIARVAYRVGLAAFAALAVLFTALSIVESPRHVVGDAGLERGLFDLCRVAMFIGMLCGAILLPEALRSFRRIKDDLPPSLRWALLAMIVVAFWFSGYVAYAISQYQERRRI